MLMNVFIRASSMRNLIMAILAALVIICLAPLVVGFVAGVVYLVFAFICLSMGLWIFSGIITACWAWLTGKDPYVKSDDKPHTP